MSRRSTIVLPALGLVLAATFVAAPAQASPQKAPSAQETESVRLVASAVLDRLEIADDVAASKLLSGKPVADPAREQAVIDATVAAAKEKGVDPVAAERIMRAQILASKEVQIALIRGWRRDESTAPTSAPDLATSIRPRINAVDDKLIPAIGAARDALQDPKCTSIVTNVRSSLGVSLDDVHRKAFRKALATLCDARD